MSTMERLRDILGEQFGPERAAALDENAKPWHEAIGAKTIDILDFKLFVQEQFAVYPHPYFFDEKRSLAEIRDYIDAATPNLNPY